MPLSGQYPRSRLARLRLWFPLCAMVLLFLVLIFAIILPTFERELLAGKEDSIRYLTQAAWSIVSHFHEMERAGEMSRSEAQHGACQQLRIARYGPEMKDYFWIFSEADRVVMHPYLREIEGLSASEIGDEVLTRNVAEVQQQIRQTGDGFINYIWQHQDNARRQSAKRAYVRTFKPWGWHIGTGVYLDDVAAETAALRNSLLAYLGTIFVVVTGLTYLTLRQNSRMERAREQAVQALRTNEERLRTILNTLQAGVVIIAADSHEILDANPAALHMIGAERDRVVGAICHKYICPAEVGRCPISDLGLKVDNANKILLRADGRQVKIIKTVMPTDLGGRNVFIESFVDISAHVAAEEALKRHVEELSEAKRRLEVLVSNIAGREKRMVELKGEVNGLLEQLGRSPKYETPANVERLLATRSDDQGG